MHTSAPPAADLSPAARAHLATLTGYGTPPPQLPDRPLVWSHRWWYTFLTGYGCGGPEHDSTWLSERPWSRGELAELRAAARHTRAARPGSPVPSASRWSATIGELWDAVDAAAAAQQPSTLPAATRFTDAGLVEVSADVAAYGYGCDDPHLPVAVIANEGCRCGHSGETYDVPDDPDDDVAAVTGAGCWVADLDGSVLVVSATDSAPGDVIERFAAARAAWDRVLVDAACAAATRDAAVRPFTEVMGYSVEQYRDYLEALGVGRGVRLELRPTAPPVPAPLRPATVVAAARRAWAVELTAAGLHLVERVTSRVDRSGKG